MQNISKDPNFNNSVIAEQKLVQQPKFNRLEQLLSMLPFIKSNNKTTIAILRLDGLIGKISPTKNGMSLAGLNKLIEKAFNFKKLGAVLLAVNSPGGSPVQSELIAKRIMQLSEEKNVPVYSFVEDVAVSGGYWLAAAGEKIYTSKSSLIGSIGVVSSSFGFVDAIKKLGVERRVYTEGKNKSILDPFKPVKEDDVKIMRSIQNKIHKSFVDYVKSRRGDRLTQDDEILFNGGFWSGEVALDFGLIDGIDDIYSFIKKNYPEDVNIEHVSVKEGLLKKILKVKQNNISYDIEDIADRLSTNFVDKVWDKLEDNVCNSKFYFK